MAQKRVKTHLIEAEELIREGRPSLARSRLDELLRGELENQAQRRKLEPHERARIIHLLRRSGAAEEALDFGFDMVRGKGAQLRPPSADEKLEYAAALIFSGLEDEGLALLDEVPSAHSPFVHLYRAFGLFPRWDYERAEPELERFLARTDENDYFYRVGQINRASSLVYLDRQEEAEQLLVDLLEKSRSQATGFLQSNALELIAQIHLARNDLAKAEVALDEAKQRSPDPDSLYRLFIDKWGYVLYLRRWPQAQDWQSHKLQALIERARRLGHHETVRDLYLQTARVSRAKPLLELLCAGTPHAAYRSRVQRELAAIAPHAVSGTNRLLDKQVLVNLEPGAFHESWSMRAERKAEVPRLLLPAPDRKYTRLFRILASDAFSPWRVPRLYQALFPGRWYDAKSARNLLHQSVHELRRGFEQEGALPLKVVWRGEEVYLQTLQPLRVELEAEPVRLTDSLLDARANHLLREIESRFEGRPFSKSELEASFDISKRTLQRYLQSLVRSRSLIQMGGGRSVRYQRAPTSR